MFKKVWYNLISPWYNLISLWRDGRTLNQKKRYIREHHPLLYLYLFEEEFSHPIIPLTPIIEYFHTKELKEADNGRKDTL